MTAHDPSDPATEQANEADLAEQRRAVVDEDETPTPTIPMDVADEADVLEQGAEVGEDDDDYR